MDAEAVTGAGDEPVTLGFAERESSLMRFVNGFKTTSGGTDLDSVFVVGGAATVSDCFAAGGLRVTATFGRAATELLLSQPISRIAMARQRAK